MDREKVIEGLEQTVLWIKNGHKIGLIVDDDFWDEMLETSENAIALLKEQKEQIKTLQIAQDTIADFLMQPEIVRCKDCKFMFEDDVFQCAIKDGYFPVTEEWFCADGELKDE